MATSEIYERFDDVKDFRLSLNAESDRGCALMAASFLDQELENIIRRFLVDSDNVFDELFGVSRPIGSFSARIDCAYMLGLIDSVIRRDLHLIRKIRNEFGHSAKPTTFEQQELASRCHKLSLNLGEKGRPPRKKYVSAAVGVLAFLHTALHKKQRLVERQPIDLNKAKASSDKMLKALQSALSDEEKNT